MLDLCSFYGKAGLNLLELLLINYYMICDILHASGIITMLMNYG